MTDDPGTFTTGVEALKSGIDILRSVFSLVKDAKEALPAGEKKDAIGAALENSERQVRLAEAQIASGLGYQLCKCEYPPQIMLTVGMSNARGMPAGPVYECPKCGFNTSHPYTFTRTKPALA